MENNKADFEAIEGDVQALLDKLSEVTTEDVMDDINSQIGIFEGEQEALYEDYLLAQESFNALAKEKIAAEAARAAS